ncbi:MAG: hypothetical protein ACW96U_01010 [Candidatus Heimdallarchaeaceae archaeon]|jgi:hypothetical protein
MKFLRPLILAASITASGVIGYNSFVNVPINIEFAEERVEEKVPMSKDRSVGKGGVYQQEQRAPEPEKDDNFDKVLEILKVLTPLVVPILTSRRGVSATKKVVKGKLKIGDRRTKTRNTTGQKRRATDIKRKK